MTHPAKKSSLTREGYKKRKPQNSKITRPGFAQAKLAAAAHFALYALREIKNGTAHSPFGEGGIGNDAINRLVTVLNWER